MVLLIHHVVGEPSSHRLHRRFARGGRRRQKPPRNLCNSRNSHASGSFISPDLAVRSPGRTNVEVSRCPVQLDALLRESATMWG